MVKKARKGLDIVVKENDELSYITLFVIATFKLSVAVH